MPYYYLIEDKLQEGKSLFNLPEKKTKVIMIHFIPIGRKNLKNSKYLYRLLLNSM